MKTDTTYLDFHVQHGELRDAIPITHQLNDGRYHIPIEAIKSGFSMHQPTWSKDVPTGPYQFSANLNIPDSFSQFIGLLISIRASGTLLIREPRQISVIEIHDNVVTHHSTQASNGSSESLNTLFLRLLKPIRGHAEWRCTAASARAQILSQPLQHLLLDSLRILDEQHDASKNFLSQLPLTARLVPTISEQSHDPILTRLRTLIGVPPYYVDQLILEPLDAEIMKLINSAVQQEILVIKREEEHTTPPHITANFDVERLDLQNLVSRFNHVFRRLAHLCDWEPSELEQQLIVFCQFYGYRDLFDDVTQHTDGAIDPVNLIENTVQTTGSRVSKQIRLGEALQELLYFELASARNIDPKERRALMSTTTQILSSLNSTDTINVA